MNFLSKWDIMLLLNNFEEVNYMVLKVIYEKGLLRPEKPLKGFKEGEELEIEIASPGFYWRGALKKINSTSKDLKHKIKHYWSKKYVSD